MSYNTVDQFLQFSPTSGSFGNVPSAVVQEQLNTAGNLIDSAIAVKHVLPLNPVPSAVFDAERVIAAWYLWQNAGYDPATKSDWLAHRYYEVVGDPDKPDSGWLGQLAFGRRMLTAGTVGDLTVSGSSPALNATQAPSYKIAAGRPRNWYSHGRRGRDVIT